MAFIDKYELGHSQEFNIVGRQEQTEDLRLSPNPVSTSGNLTGTVKDTNGNAVNGATVKVLDINNNPIEHVNTGAQGQFTINNISAGSYQVVAVKDGYLLPAAVPAVIQTNKTTTINIIITADPDASLSAIFGIVSSNNDLTPIKDVIVSLYKNSQPPVLTGSTSTNDKGQYLFTVTSTGQYYVEASKIGYTSKQSAPIDVGTKEFISTDILMVADPNANTGTVGGFIRDNDTGEPIPNAIVALYSIVNKVETIVDITKTSASGRYLFANVIPGEYRVKATLAEE